MIGIWSWPFKTAIFLKKETFHKDWKVFGLKKIRPFLDKILVEGLKNKYAAF